MWKQWVNVVLGILVIIGVYSGIHVGWVVTGVAIMLILSFWAALEETGGERRSALHAR
jgi:hypothetical protein